MKIEEKIIGCWKPESFVFDLGGGKTLYPFGGKPVGILIYDKSGYMSASVMKPARLNFGSGDQSVATYEELMDSANYIGYAGRYTIKEREIIHDVEISYFPNWVGTSQKRFYSFREEKLILTTEPILNNGKNVVAKLEWSRVH